MLLYDHLIVALDIDNLREALSLVDDLGDQVQYYKVGSHLYTKYGPHLLEQLAHRDKKVFLDLKYHDIPSVVAKSISSLQNFSNVFMCTVHVDGGVKMMQAASEAAPSSTDVVGVTTLTSSDEYDSLYSLKSEVNRQARLAVEDGFLDGVVCPPPTLQFLNLNSRSVNDYICVTPGIRPSFEDVEEDDQNHTLTPEESLEHESSYLVMGRPIYQSDDPVETVNRIQENV